MKTNNRLRKIRIIVSNSNHSNPVYGVVLPSYLMERWEGVSVRVSESGNCIILASGAKLKLLSKNELRQTSQKAGEIYI